MKKLIFLLIMIGTFFSHNVNAQSIESSPNVYYVTKARPDAESSLMRIAHVENNTGFPVQFSPDYSIGNNFVLEMWVDNQLYSSSREFLSNEMNARIKNATGAVSMNDLCLDQARAMRNEFNKGNKFREDYLRRLAEQANRRFDNSDLRTNYDRYMDMNKYPVSDNNDYILITENQGKTHYPHLENNRFVKKKTWFGKHWWVIPAALAVGYLTYDLLTPGGLFDFNRSNTTIIIINPNDPNDPNNPDHNPSGQNMGGEFPGKSLQNMALDKVSKRAISSPGGITISLGFLRL